MELKKNDIFTVKITDMSDDGSGIGKHQGFTWFIKDTVAGDTVEASVMKMKKSYGFAKLQKILQPSPSRTEARCATARRCGGCQLQEMDYKAQLQFKENKVYNNLCRIGGLEDFRNSPDQGTWTMEPIIGMENPWRYRNKAQFPMGRSKDGRIVAGFYAGRTHDIIENHDCLLGAEENKVILDIIINFMETYGIEPYCERSHTGMVRHVLIRKGFSTGEIMVCLVINGNVLPYGEMLAAELAKIPGMTSICCNLNKEKTNVILGKKVYSIYGPQYITDYIGHVKYQISPVSFYQVNPVQTERLYGTALEYAGLTGNETVWDLYCGIGTISLFLAQHAKKVYGVEIVPQAIEDARRNAMLNRMENVEFFVGKAEEVLPEKYEKEQIYADVIVVDPPRKGCDPACLDTIVKMGPQRVVYVSCDSATLARDVKYLEERGYQVEKARCCDMFPMTGHVETVALLTIDVV